MERLNKSGFHKNLCKTCWRTISSERRMDICDRCLEKEYQESANNRQIKVKYVQIDSILDIPSIDIIFCFIPVEKSIS